MAKQKKPDEPPKGSPAWMASWSDMMSVLCCFFIMLFAMSSIDAEKFEAFAASFSSSFSIFQGGGSTADAGGTMIANGATQLHDLGELFNSTGMNPEGNVIPEGVHSGEENTLEEMTGALAEAGLAESETMAELIEESIAERNLGGMVDIHFTSQYVMLSMSGSLLFDSGSVELKNDAVRVLSQLAAIIQRHATGNIQIEGHTDNVPMSGGGRYATNDELSSGRAYSVFTYLMENSALDPARVIHAGRGEHIPVAGNETAEGRAMNRRVEIKLFNSLSSF